MRAALIVGIAASLTGAASAQVVLNDGGGPVPGATHTLNFDTPFVPSGPTAGNAFAGAGFANFTLLGTWTAGSDTITAGSNGSGQSLVSRLGSLSIAGVGEPLDNVAAGGGLEVTLGTPATAFSWLFVDQINMGYQVELFNGATSLGVVNATYGGGTGSFPYPESNVDASGAAFDRVRITFTGFVAGVGFDNFAYVAVPAPASLALLGLGGLVASRRRR